MNKAFDSAEIETNLKSFPRWKLVSGAIEREFVFSDFKEAFAFMTKVAVIAEDLNHHPDWTNVYNRVKVRLNTHDAHGITNLDFELARRIDNL